MIGLRTAATLAERLRLTPTPARARAVTTLARPTRPRVLGFVNAHAVNLCAVDRQARRAFLGADVLLRDGAGMALMLRLLGVEPGANMNGTDLIPQLLAHPGLRVALYGGRPGVAEAAARRLPGVRVVAARHGYAAEADYLRWMAEDDPDLIVLGMGMPLQERLALRLRDASDRPRLIVCGGAILDFIAGRAVRAPRWMRRCGLEWLWRLGCEPQRLFLRYVLGNPLFMLRALILALAPSAARPSAAASENTSPAITAW